LNNGIFFIYIELVEMIIMMKAEAYTWDMGAKRFEAIHYE